MSKLDDIERMAGLVLELARAEAVQAVAAFDSGETTLRHLDKISRRLSRVYWRLRHNLRGPARKAYEAYSAGRRSILEAARRRVLSKPAPPCPHCDQEVGTVEALIAHLQNRHGWHFKGKCLCGAGNSWGVCRDDRLMKLAVHLLAQKDLAVRLAGAVLKKAAEGGVT